MEKTQMITNSSYSLTKFSIEAHKVRHSIISPYSGVGSVCWLLELNLVLPEFDLESLKSNVFVNIGLLKFLSFY